MANSDTTTSSVRFRVPSLRQEALPLLLGFPRHLANVSHGVEAIALDTLGANDRGKCGLGLLEDAPKKLCPGLLTCQNSVCLHDLLMRSAQACSTEVPAKSYRTAAYSLPSNHSTRIKPLSKEAAPSKAIPSNFQSEPIMELPEPDIIIHAWYPRGVKSVIASGSNRFIGHGVSQPSSQAILNIRPSGPSVCSLT